jgi:mRNA interferase YafQ
MYETFFSPRFKKDFKLVVRRGWNVALLREVILQLANNQQLPRKHQDHKLYGKYLGSRECHVLSDWLLIYKIDHSAMVIDLIATGTHSDLF